jgi:NAD(P)-dependent dehydrogenase (short-subunit alcohol dehydrogenase family)
VHAVPGDVSEPAGMAGLAERIRERIGNPTTLYYGPSVGGFSTATDLTPDQIESHLPVALSSLVGLVREFLPPMIERREGAILVAGGMSAVHGMRNFSGPGPALAAQRNYLQSLTAEVAEHGVFVGRLYIGTAIIGSAWHKRMLAQAGDGSPAGSPAGPAPVDPETLADLLREMHRAGKPAETLYPEEFRAR